MGIQKSCIMLVTQPFEKGIVLYTTKNRHDGKDRVGGRRAKGSFFGPNFGFGATLSIHITR